jgi:cytochrome c556
MGTKESWQKLTAAFATNATTFDHAAQAKDREAAKTAHALLSDSCMQCHREHRRMKGGKAG